MASQYHFQFPSEVEAKRFVYLIAWQFDDVALCRQEKWVIVIDDRGGRDEAILRVALNTSEVIEVSED